MKNNGVTKKIESYNKSIGIFWVGIIIALIGGQFLNMYVKHININTIFFLVIILTFIGYSISVYINSKDNINDLKKMELELEKIEDIVEEFDSFDAKINEFSDESKLKKIWRNYKKTFFEIKNDDENDLMRHQTIDADYFFNEETLIKEVIHYKVIVYLPQFFLGVGIFGTFLGLVIGLKGIDLTATNSEDIKNGITELLGGVTVSFNTSVLGIYFSLLASLLINYYFEYYEKRVTTIKNLINAKFIRNQNERVLSSIKDELSEIKISNNDLAKNMGNELGERLNGLVESMNQGMKNFSENVGNDFKETLTQNLNKVFTEELVQKFDDISKNLVGTIEKNQEYSKSLGVIIEEGLVTTLDKIKDLIEKTENALSTANQFTNEVRIGFEETNSNLRGTAEIMNQIYTDIKGLNNEVIELSKETKEIFQNRESFEKIGEIFNKLEGLTGVFLEKIKSEEQVSNIWKNFDKDFKNTNQLLVNSFADYRNEIKNSTIGFKDLINEVAMNSENFIEENTKKYQEVVNNGISNLFREYDANLSDVIGKFNSVLMNLNEKMDNLEIYTKEENEIYEKQLKSTSELSSVLKEIIDLNKNLKKGFEVEAEPNKVLEISK